MRSISSTVIVSAVRSESFVVFRRRVSGDLLRVLERPPFDRYAVIPSPGRWWQHVDGGTPAAAAPPLDHGQDETPRQYPACPPEPLSGQPMEWLTVKRYPELTPRRCARRFGGLEHRR